MSENTPKSKEEMEKALENLQLDPEDLDAVAGGVEGTCSTCYSDYNPQINPGLNPGTISKT